jgi:microcystin-dependent protein
MEPFLGELRLMSFSFPPKGWALCNGQTLLIAQNQALFALLGTTYGGNGQTTFRLPDLRGRSALHWNGSLPLGVTGGQEAVTLSAAQMPAHTHTLIATSDLATASVPGGAVPATKGRGGINRYAPAGASDTVMDSSALAMNAGGQPHPNMQPFAVLSWAIALQGIFPSRD